jgi:putative ABC transport system substrate-binding protein
VRNRLLLALLLFGGLVPGPARSQSTDVLTLETENLGPYRTAHEAFEDSLADGYRVNRLSLDLDHPEEDARRVVETGARVLVALGSRATTWALENTETTPVVFSMVLHPVQSGFIRSFESPGGRVTGAALDIPPRSHLRVLRDALGARRVAVLYDPSETGSLVDAARKEARPLGMQIVAIPVRDLGSLPQALSKVDSSVDALWSVPDPTVFSRAGAKKVLLHTLDRQIPFMGLSEHYVRAGALLAVAASYEENGRQVADRVTRILRGESPGRIPVARPEGVEVVYNPNTAHRLGLDDRSPSLVGFRRVD